MSAPQGSPLLERMLARAARRLSAAGLHPLRLRDDIAAAFDAAVSGGEAPNDISVGLNPRDFGRLSPELDAFRADMRRLLAARATARGWRAIAALDLVFRADPTVAEGSATIEARFVHRHVAAVAPSSNATQRLTPVRGLSLVLSGGETIPVIRLPFSIGRAPSNDLVLASMAVSRAHAEIVWTPDGLVMRDLGSHNGITIDGRPAAEAAIHDGQLVGLGDVELTVRFEAR